MIEQLQQSSGSYELVLSAVILGLMGLGLDRWLGTTPLFTVVLTVLGFAGAGISLYYRYRHQIASLEQETKELRAQRSEASDQ